MALIMESKCIANGWWWSALCWSRFTNLMQKLEASLGFHQTAFFPRQIIMHLCFPYGSSLEVSLHPFYFLYMSIQQISWSTSVWNAILGTRFHWKKLWFCDLFVVTTEVGKFWENHGKNTASTSAMFSWKSEYFVYIMLLASGLHPEQENYLFGFGSYLHFPLLSKGGPSTCWLF